MRGETEQIVGRQIRFGQWNILHQGRITGLLFFVFRIVHLYVY
jgi:hypothetical protein